MNGLMISRQTLNEALSGACDVKVIRNFIGVIVCDQARSDFPRINENAIFLFSVKWDMSIV